MRGPRLCRKRAGEHDARDRRREAADGRRGARPRAAAHRDHDARTFPRGAHAGLVRGRVAGGRGHLRGTRAAPDARGRPARRRRRGRGGESGRAPGAARGGGRRRSTRAGQRRGPAGRLRAAGAAARAAPRESTHAGLGAHPERRRRVPRRRRRERRGSRVNPDAGRSRRAAELCPTLAGRGGVPRAARRGRVRELYRRPSARRPKAVMAAPDAAVDVHAGSRPVDRFRAEGNVPRLPIVDKGGRRGPRGRRAAGRREDHKKMPACLVRREQPLPRGRHRDEALPGCWLRRLPPRVLLRRALPQTSLKRGGGVPRGRRGPVGLAEPAVRRVGRAPRRAAGDHFP